MTYLQFHLLFNLPALLLLLWLTRRRLRAAHWKWIAILCGIVLAATTPWDNWAVYRGIWTFDWTRTHAIEATLGGVRWRLPAEEYAFFLIETVMVALLTLLFLPVPPPASALTATTGATGATADEPAARAEADGGRKGAAAGR